jgi:hypothetical protein
MEPCRVQSPVTGSDSRHGASTFVLGPTSGTIGNVASRLTKQGCSESTTQLEKRPALVAA